MELYTIEYMMTNEKGDRTSGCLYFKDEHDALKYKAEYLDSDDRITIDTDNDMGRQWLDEKELFDGINEVEYNRVYDRLYPRTKTVEKVVEKTVYPTFYRVQWTDQGDSEHTRIFTDRQEALDLVGKVLGNDALGGIEITELPFERVIDILENM